MTASTFIRFLISDPVMGLMVLGCFTIVGSLACLVLDEKFHLYQKLRRWRRQRKIARRALLQHATA